MRQTAMRACALKAVLTGCALAGGALTGSILSGCASTAVAPPPALTLQQAPALVPAPQQLTRQQGSWQVPQRVAVVMQGDNPHAYQALQTLLADSGLTMGATSPATVRLQTSVDAALGEEGYRLHIEDGITLRAQTDQGLFYAVQTLRQLMQAQPNGQKSLPHITIMDVPQYPWRGLSLDVARSFLPVAYLQKHIDRMAYFKLNRLHLHLTDDQGWRVEIKQYPKLTQVGGASAVKNGRTGFYTQEELKALVTYAAERGITLVPEVDMPSHVQAAIASYNELACDDVTNLSTYSGYEVGFNILCLSKPDVVYPFVRGVLTELTQIFPSEYIHVGGDEIKHPLYADFVGKATKIVNELGRKAVVWEEGSVADSRPDTLVQLWNDSYDIAPALAKGHSLILSPCSYFYIDHSNYPGQPETYTWCRKEGVPLNRVYSFKPENFTQVVGVEAALWSELVHTDAAADNRLWPRLAAVAELGWSPASQRSYAGFTQRLRALRPQMDGMGIQYYQEPDVGFDKRLTR